MTVAQAATRRLVPKADSAPLSLNALIHHSKVKDFGGQPSDWRRCPTAHNDPRQHGDDSEPEVGLLNGAPGITSGRHAD